MLQKKTYINIFKLAIERLLEGLSMKTPIAWGKQMISVGHNWMMLYQAN